MAGHGAYRREEGDREVHDGQIFKVSGPLCVADKMSGSFMHELVRVGPKRIVGEIIKLEGDTASIQCYEDTSGLTVGDLVHRTQASAENGGARAWRISSLLFRNTRHRLPRTGAPQRRIGPWHHGKHL